MRYPNQTKYPEYPEKEKKKIEKNKIKIEMFVLEILIFLYISFGNVISAKIQSFEFIFWY